MTTTKSTRKSPPATVTFVGAGPGDPGLLTLRAVEALALADAVIIDQVAREDVVARHCRDDVEVIDAGQGDHGQQLTHASNAKLVVRTAKAKAGGTVVRLMDGDPATFNGLAEEALACAKAGIAFEIVPGVSATSGPRLRGRATHRGQFDRDPRPRRRGAGRPRLPRPTRHGGRAGQRRRHDQEPWRPARRRSRR
jgi:siroheme synthase